MGENIAFGVLAAAMALSAIGVVTTNNVVHAALFLVVPLIIVVYISLTNWTGLGAIPGAKGLQN